MYRFFCLRQSGPLRRKVVVERVLSAMSLLAKLSFHSAARIESTFLSRQIMTPYDVAELVFAAISDQYGELPSKDPHYRMDEFEPLETLRRNQRIGPCPVKMVRPVASLSVGRAYFVAELVVSDIDQSQCFPASSTIVFTSSCRR